MVPAGPVLKHVIRGCLGHLGCPEGRPHLLWRNSPAAAVVQLSRLPGRGERPPGSDSVAEGGGAVLWVTVQLTRGN